MVLHKKADDILQKLTDAYYTLLADTPAQTESLLHRKEAARGIGFYMNTN